MVTISSLELFIVSAIKKMELKFRFAERNDAVMETHAYALSSIE